MNKITPQTFEKLTGVLCEVRIDSSAMLQLLIELVFEKAVQEQNFANMYAEMCASLEKQSRFWNFIQVAFNRDMNQFIWVIDLPFDIVLAGPYGSSKECQSAVLGVTMPPMQTQSCKLVISELIIAADILIKVRNHFN